MIRSEIVILIIFGLTKYVVKGRVRGNQAHLHAPFYRKSD